MKQIVIRYPDDVPEQKAAAYAEAAFDIKQNDYMRLMENPGTESSFQYRDGRDAVMWANKTGYVLKLMELTE